MIGYELLEVAGEHCFTGIYRSAVLEDKMRIEMLLIAVPLLGEIPEEKERQSKAEPGDDQVRPEAEAAGVIRYHTDVQGI